MRNYPVNRLGWLNFIIVIWLALCVGGCSERIPPEVLQLQPESLSLRRLQTRRFDTRDEREILLACSGVLQDLGFNLDESETRVGLIVGSKHRDATDTGQVIGSVLMAALLGAEVPYDSEQKIRASIVTRPVDKQINVRITFQRLVWNNKRILWKVESLEDEKLYQEFFEKLSKSVFLQAQQI